MRTEPLLIGLWSLGFILSTAAAQPTTQVTIEPAADRRQRLHDFYLRTIVDAYAEKGRHDPAWDADARLVLESLARQMAWSYCPSGDEWDIIASAGKRATDAGCTDPLVLLAMARSAAYFGRRPDDTHRFYIEAAKRMGESGYHPLLKCLANFPAAALRARDRTDPLASRRAGRRMVEVGLDALQRALADPQVPPNEILDTFDQIGDASRYVERDRAIVFDRAYALLVDAYKDRPSFLLAVRQQFLIDYAMDAKRDASVPEEQREQLFKSRLSEAASAGEQAVQRDPTNARAAEMMMHVASLLGEPAEAVDRWFQRAITAGPGRYQPYATRLALYDPAVKSEIPAMLDFARRAAVGADWQSGIPMLLVEAHLRAATYEHGKRLEQPRRGYFTAEVWKEIDQVYREYLSRYPRSVYHRSRYATLAAWAGQTQVAREQLALLGDDYSLTWFRSKEGWLLLKSELSQNIATPH